MAKRINSRQKGKMYECKLRKELKELGFEDCETSRFASKMTDDMKVDFVNTKPFNIQAKAVETGINYHKLLREMPKDTNWNVIIHKKNNSKDIENEIVVMSKKAFYSLIEKMKIEGIL